MRLDMAVAGDALLVSEESIKAGHALTLQARRALVVEPAAALGVAALLEPPGRYASMTVATIPLRRQRGAKRLRSMDRRRLRHRRWAARS